MSFTVTYYIDMACPTIEKSIEMIGKYIERGAKAFQIDMPSHDPYGETDFIKKMMHDALEAHPDYDYYMDGFRTIRKLHPEARLSIVVYKDVIDQIGIEKFTDFCNEIGMFSVRLAGKDDRVAYTDYMTAHGLACQEGVGYYMPEADIQRAIACNCVVQMRSKRVTEELNPQYDTWEKRVGYLRQRGITKPILAIADMKTAADLIAAREGGADGVIVGNALMQLWENEEELWKKFDEFQGTQR